MNITSYIYKCKFTYTIKLFATPLHNMYIHMYAITCKYLQGHSVFTKA